LWLPNNMLPYIEIITINLGPITLQFWGLMVSLGFIVAIILAYFLAKKSNIKTDHIFNLAFWILLSSLIFARIFHVLFYEPVFYFQNLVEVFKIWHGGLSVFGGFIGAIIAYYLYVRKHKLDFWRLGDLLIFTLPLGLAVGRLGCTFIHDHPGRLTDFFLAFNYPGGPRHDLGFYLSLTNLFIFILFLIFYKLNKDRFAGFYVVAYALIYGVARFFLDFLRAADVVGADARYFGLTPAQYASLVFVALGLFLFYRLKYKEVYG